MMTIATWETRAIEELTQGRKKVTGTKEVAMADAVMATLKDFCKQSEEFAQAVAQGGSFVDCMKTVAKGVGNHISDIDAFQRAVGFYFPGAKIRVQMAIDLVGDVAASEKPAGGITLDFSAFL